MAIYIPLLFDDPLIWSPAATVYSICVMPLGYRSLPLTSCFSLRISTGGFLASLCTLVKASVDSGYNMGRFSSVAKMIENDVKT